MAKVFISYASTDPVASGLERLIHNRLAEAGIESVPDLSKIAPGHAIDAAIRRVLPTVKTVVMVVSASSVDSKWMMAEWAKDRRMVSQIRRAVGLGRGVSCR